MSSEDLDREALLRERIMLGLRLRDGVDLDLAGRDLGVDPWPARRTRAADALIGRDRLARDGGRIWIPHGAWLFTDDTASRLF
jgi:oxygen-independent coproporphyrinogen-3 oxidase